MFFIAIHMNFPFMASQKHNSVRSQCDLHMPGLSLRPRPLTLHANDLSDASSP